MEPKTDSTTDPGAEEGGDGERAGGVGIVQTLGLGLIVFTILMVLMGIVLALFADLTG